MILTCPACATSYFLDDARFGAAPRSVRCASCGESWRAAPDEAAIDLSTPVAAEPPPEPSPSLDKDKALPQAFRAKAEARRQTARAAAAGVVWGGLGAAVVALLVGAVVFRIDVVRLWPRTAGAYAKVGLTVNPVGLSPENVQAQPGLQDGHLAVTVTGMLRNVETRPRRPVPLRVILMDKAGKPLVDTVVRTGSAPIEPGKAAPFNANFVDPPAAAVNVQVEFVFDPAASKAGGHGPSTLKLRGPAQPALPPLAPAKAAEALPSNSPYALPVSDHQAAADGAPVLRPALPAAPPQHG